MSITRKLIRWIDRVEDNSLKNDETPMLMFKASCTGLLEGAMDAAIVLLPIAMVCNIISLKAKK